MLKILPDASFPLTRKSIDPLMENVVNLNYLNAGITGNVSRGLSIALHAFDIWVKSKGKIDYRGVAGHERMKQDAKTFVSGSAIVTRTGELSAAHLAIDYHDTQIRMKEMGMPPLPCTVNGLMEMAIDLCMLSDNDEKEIGLLLDYCGKKANLK